jgi:hypothetical protein
MNIRVRSGLVFTSFRDDQSNPWIDKIENLGAVTLGAPASNPCRKEKSKEEATGL